MPRRVLDAILVVIGAAVGGAVGYAAFVWMYNYGFYAAILPGALLGLGGALFARERSVLRGALLGLAGLALGLYTEWKYFPFIADGSLAYFLTNVPQVNPVHLLMIAVGTFFAFWWGRDAVPSVFNRPRAARAQPSSTSDKT
jgi:hypothetical protein